MKLSHTQTQLADLLVSEISEKKTEKCHTFISFYFDAEEKKKNKKRRESNKSQQESYMFTVWRHQTSSFCFVAKSLSFSGKTRLAFQVRRVFTTIGFVSSFKVDPNRLGWKSTFHVIFKFRFRLHMISVLFFTFTKILLYIYIIWRMSGCFNKYVLIS